jgi:RIO kinase 1
MSKRTRHGRAKDEAAWRSTEVEMIYRLRDAGVRVPEPHHFVDGVLVMELIKDRDGSPAPRLGDLSFSAASAIEVHQQLLADVIRMLCAGVIHGDLSEFNVLMGADGPVLIDFPQAVDPSSNQNARKLLLRDVDNLQRFLARFARGGRSRGYGQEMWSLYQANKLHADTELTGTWQRARQSADTSEVLALIQDARQEARPGRVELDAGEDNTEETAVPPPRRVVVDFTSERKAAPRKKAASRKGARPRRRARAKSSASASKPSSSTKAPARRTRRRPRRRSPAPGTPRSR